VQIDLALKNGDLMKRIILVSVVFLFGLITFCILTGYNFETINEKKTASQPLPEPVYAYWKNNKAEIS